MRCTLYLVRHGRSEHNRDNIVSGHVNPRLTNEGELQALETKEKLKNVKFDTVYSSDLQRAQHTAELIFGGPVPKDHQLFGLRERAYGALDGAPGKHLINLRDLHSPKIKQMSHPEQWAFKYAPDIESDLELAERFITTLEQIAEKHPGETVLIGSHGGVLRIMLIELGFMPAEQLPPGCFRNAGYAKLTFEDGEFQVEKVEGVDYLKNGV